MNGGTCRNTYGSYRCDCPPLFTGPKCEGGKYIFFANIPEKTHRHSMSLRMFFTSFMEYDLHRWAAARLFNRQLSNYTLRGCRNSMLHSSTYEE